MASVRASSTRECWRWQLWLEGDLQLVDGICTRLVHTGMLAGGTDEQSREQIRQGWVIVPVTDQASQQIGAPQEGTVLGSWAADDHVVATAGAGVLSVQHEFLRAQAAL